MTESRRPKNSSTSLKLGPASWAEIRNAVARDNRQIPIDVLIDKLTILEPIFDAILALPAKLLDPLDNHRYRGTLEKVLRKAIAQIEPPRPLRKIDRDIASGPVIELVGEGIGELVSVEEGKRRLDAITVHRSLEDWAGPLADAAEIERKWGIPRTKLQNWRKLGVAIGLRKGKHRYVYPLGQFEGGVPIDGIRDVVQLSRDPLDAWEWLITPKPSIGGVPLGLLKKGKLYDVLEAAEYDFGEHWNIWWDVESH
jgi:hypothetical protein